MKVRNKNCFLSKVKIYHYNLTIVHWRTPGVDNNFTIIFAIQFGQPVNIFSIWVVLISILEEAKKVDNILLWRYFGQSSVKRFTWRSSPVRWPVKQSFHFDLIKQCWNRMSVKYMIYLNEWGSTWIRHQARWGRKQHQGRQSSSKHPQQSKKLPSLFSIHHRSSSKSPSRYLRSGW